MLFCRRQLQPAHAIVRSNLKSRHVTYVRFPSIPGFDGCKSASASPVICAVPAKHAPNSTAVRGSSGDPAESYAGFLSVVVPRPIAGQCNQGPPSTGIYPVLLMRKHESEKAYLEGQALGLVGGVYKSGVRTDLSFALLYSLASRHLDFVTLPC